MHPFIKWAGLATLAFITQGTSDAWAGCPAYRLTGIWHIYLTPSDRSWLKCELLIGLDGTLGPASYCEGEGLPQSRASGDIHDLPGCVISGNFTSNGEKYTIRKASLNVDNLSASGIMRLGGGKFAPFQALKQ